jgi:hypothetical protein
MKITAVEAWWTRIPFDMGGKPATTGGLNWQTMNTVWLRIVTDQGLEGWGEAFGHASAATTMAVLDTQLAPAVLGEDAAISRARLSKAFHGFGRNGAHVSRCGGARHQLGHRRAACWPGGCSAHRPSHGSSPMRASCATARHRWSPPPANAPWRAATATSSCTRSPSPRSAPRARRSARGPADGGYQLPLTVWQAIHMARRMRELT